MLPFAGRSMLLVDDDLRLLELIHRELGDDSAVLELLKSHEASKIIEVLK